MTTPPSPGPVSAALLLARLWHGRPGRLAARILGTFAVAEITLHSGADVAAVAGTLAGIATWLVITSAGDIAPPPGR